MKKIIFIIAAVALIASPAMAVDWNFYGSARMATYYISRDFNNAAFADLDGGGLTNGKLGKDEDARTQWELQGNSRLGATVKGENVGGRFEFGISDDNGGGNVSSRRIFGTWDFGAATLKVGKDYTPIAQFVSGQVFDGDAGLLGNGAAYGARRGQVSLSFGGFEVALIENNGADNVIANITTGDVDVYFPKIEASFGMSFDTWNFKIIGGYNYYEIEDGGVLANKSIDVDSYILGADVGFSFGPATIRAAGSFGQNFNEAGWAFNDDPQASFSGGSSVDDVKVAQALAAVNFKFHDGLSFEGGVGYIYADPDSNLQKSSNGVEGYVNAVISMAPGVFLVPEVGYKTFLADYGDTNFAQGSQFYLGGKWQIDF